MQRTASFCLLATTTLLGVPGCKLTESIRTRPAPPGPATSPTSQPLPDGSLFPPVDAGGDASEVRDGQTNDRAPAKDGAAGGAGDSGGGGTSGAGGDASSAGTGGDGTGGARPNVWDGACGPPSSACERYCTAMSVAPGCPPAEWITDAGVQPAYFDECTCRCEGELRADCRSEFDELIACGGVPLMLTCTEDDAFPIVSGVCGGRQFALTECLAENNQVPTPDASTDASTD